MAKHVLVPLGSSHAVYGAILYLDTESYDFNTVLEKWQSYFVEWAYIIHLYDTNEDGTEKKPHCHIFGRHSTNAKIDTVIAKTGIPHHFFEVVRSEKAFIQYFLHWAPKDRHKYQYDFKEIQSNFDIKHHFSNTPDYIMAKQITEYIYSDKCSGIRDLTEFCIGNGLWSEFRRGQSIFRELLKDAKFIKATSFSSQKRDDFNNSMKGES